MSQPRGTQIELLESLPEVLQQLGIDPDELFGKMSNEQRSGLESLRNIRNNKPVAPKRPHTPFTIFTDRLDTLLPDLRKVSDRLSTVCSKRLPGNEETVIYSKDGAPGTTTTFDKKEWLAYCGKLSTNDPPKERVFDLPSRDVVMPAVASKWRKAAEDRLKTVNLGPLAGKMTCKSHNVAITPQSILTHIHADSRLDISTVAGAMKPEMPVKLWIVWPSTELHHLTDCLGNTKDALGLLDHGSFYVQMNGESMMIPANSPHAVYTFQTCYLYASPIKMSGPTLGPCPAYLRIMLEQDMEEREACEVRVQALSTALASGDVRARRAHAQDFLAFWGTDACIFRKPEHAALLEKLARVWAADIRSTRSCVWCTRGGCDPERMAKMLQGLDVKGCKQHARRHLAFEAVAGTEKGEQPPVSKKTIEKDGPAELMSRGRKRKAELETTESQKRSRKSRPEPEPEPEQARTEEPQTRSRKRKADPAETAEHQTHSHKRRANPTEMAEEPQKRTRKRKVAVAETEKPKSRGYKRKAET